LLAAGLAAVLHDLTGSDILYLPFKAGKEEPTGPWPVPLRLQHSERGSSRPDKCNRARNFLRGDSVATHPGAGYYAERASNIISKIGDRFPFILFDIDVAFGAAADAIPMFADVHIEVVDSVPPAVKSDGPPAR